MNRVLTGTSLPVRTVDHELDAARIAEHQLRNQSVQLDRVQRSDEIEVIEGEIVEESGGRGRVNSEAPAQTIHDGFDRNWSAKQAKHNKIFNYDEGARFRHENNVAKYSGETMPYKSIGDYITADGKFRA